MQSTVGTASLDPRERFDFWQEMLSHQAVPVRARTRHTEDFTGSVQALQAGRLKVVTTENRSVDVDRTPALIRRADPETYIVVISHQGEQQLGQDGNLAVIGPGEMVLLHTSRPFHTVGDPHRGHQLGTVLMIEPTELSLPPRRLNRLVAQQLSTEDSLVPLVSQYVLGFSRGRFHPDDVGRLASITMSLVSLMLARRLDSAADLPPEVRQDALFARLRAHIIDHLGDPGLTPEAVAAAHHISVRTLHRVFETNEVTMAAWVRGRRLERCRADLVDPALATRSVSSIARRWGFTDAAHFTRTFRAAYGRTPTAYRTQARRRQGAGGTAGIVGTG